MLHYKKNYNSQLFESFKKSNLTNVKNIQNYIPIYKNFFNLTKNNHNAINLNHENSILEICCKKTEQQFKCKLQKKDIVNADVFFKFSKMNYVWKIATYFLHLTNMSIW